VTSLIEGVKQAGLPRHVALIMDGNGRWAKARGLSHTAGHQAGARAAERLIRFVADLGLENLTLFAFSTENWGRPRTEIDFLMKLLDRFIKDKLDEFLAAGVRLRISGDVGRLPEWLRRRIISAIEATALNDRLLLNVALNYGGKQEILRVCRRLVEEAIAGRVSPDKIDENLFRRFLYTYGLPDPDLVIRTSGEMRLSNFLLWQAAYAELYFTKTLWPDFSPEELLLAISSFQERERRFGR